MNKIFQSIIDHISSEKKGNEMLTYNVLFLGDSAASTEWVHPNWRGIVEYVVKDTLEKKLADWKRPYFYLRFLNAGLNGGDTREFIERAQIDMINFQPNLVIMIGGDNDSPEIPVDEHVANIKALKQMMCEYSEYFVYCTAPYSFSQKYNLEYDMYRQRVLQLPVLPNEIFVDLFAEYQQFDLARVYTYRVESEFESKSFDVPRGGIDYLHPNTLGQAYIAKILLDKVFGIPFDSEQYIRDVHGGLKYQRY